MGALKTFYGVMANWNGEAMDALITQENRSSILNNPGDQVSVGALELITFQSTFDLLPGVDVYEVTLVKRSDHAIYMANARGKIYIPADVVGDYEIDSVGALNKQGFDAEAQYPPEVRSVDDTGDINFFWPTHPSSITGEVQFTDDDTWQAVVGTISYVDQYGGRYLWRLPYNAANKPAAEGYSRFRLTDNTGRVHYSQVNYLDASTDADFIKRGLHKLG